MEHIGHRIERCMLTLGLSQSDVARAIGVTPSAVNQWLRLGRGLKDIGRVKKLADLLRVAPSFLLDGDGEGPMDDDDVAALQIVRSMSAQRRRDWLSWGRTIAAEEKLAIPAALRDPPPDPLKGRPANDGAALPPPRPRKLKSD